MREGRELMMILPTKKKSGGDGITEEEKKKYENSSGDSLIFKNAVFKHVVLAAQLNVKCVKCSSGPWISTSSFK
jgi:hypothetical protein